MSQSGPLFRDASGMKATANHGSGIVKDEVDEQRRIKETLGFCYDAKDGVVMDVAGRGGTILTQTTLEETVAAAAKQVHKHILSSLFEQH